MKRYDIIAQDITKKTNGFKPQMAIVLGSGWKIDFGEEKFRIKYSEIEGFLPVGVGGHSGEIVCFESNGIKLIALCGRTHFYEGHSMSDIVAAVRAVCRLGVKLVILTNAAGGANADFNAGDFMAISDHILLAPNPLIGANDATLGQRFPDMSNIYDKQATELFLKAAQQENAVMHSGVYCQFSGPSYETPAEVKMAKIMGADAVGMSTAAEAVAIKHAGVKVCGISLITNMAAGIQNAPLCHTEVTAAAGIAMQKFEKILSCFLAQAKTIL